MTPTSSLDARLSLLFEHAGRLTSASCVPAAGPTRLPRWPEPPSSVRHRTYARLLVVACSAIGAVVVAPHAWGAAEAAFGRPARPSLVGHKIGSPWHDAVPAAGQVP